MWSKLQENSIKCVTLLHTNYSFQNLFFYWIALPFYGIHFNVVQRKWISRIWFNSSASPCYYLVLRWKSLFYSVMYTTMRLTKFQCVCVGGGYNLGYKPCIIQRESIISSGMFSTGSLQHHLINKTWIQQIIWPTLLWQMTRLGSVPGLVEYCRLDQRADLWKPSSTS